MKPALCAVCWSRVGNNFANTQSECHKNSKNNYLKVGISQVSHCNFGQIITNSKSDDAHISVIPLSYQNLCMECLIKPCVTGKVVKVTLICRSCLACGA